MPRQRSDPEVTKWMKGHPEEVGRIEKLYILLRAKNPEELVELAEDLGISVAKRRVQYRENLITDIVKTAPEKALEVVLGQGVLVGASGAQTK